MGAKTEMRRAAILIVVLATASLTLAQTSSQSSPQTSGTQPSSGRPPLQTKSREEYQAYQAAIANQNPEALEKAADEFAAKFPQSEVRVLLYRAAMSSYQAAGNSQKMMDMGLKVLSFEKDDPDALIGVAEVLEERTTPTDLDRQQRANQVIDYATHALKTIDTELAIPAGTPADRVESYKKYLRSTALAIIGTIYYKQEQYPEAEAKLREAIDADPASPDAVVILRLALALDQEKKYGEALQQANRAVDLTQENTEVGKMARNERDRLLVQTSTTTPAQAPQNAAPGAPQHPVPPNN